MSSGKEVHKIIEDHCIGKKKDKRLKDFTWEFTDAERHVIRPWDDKFNLHGFIDLISYKSKVIGELKSGSVWSQKKFADAMQWRYYCYLTGFRKALLINCRFDLSGLKTYYFEATEDDMKKTELWIREATTGIENGNFKGGLDADGFCLGCSYGPACYFSKV